MTIDASGIENGDGTGEQFTIDGHTIEVLGTAERFHEVETDKGSPTFTALVVKRDGEEVDVPVIDAHRGVHEVNTRTNAETYTRRLTETFDRVYVQARDGKTPRLIAQVETTDLRAWSDVAVEAAEVLDDDGEPTGEFDIRQVTDWESDEWTIAPDEIDDEARTKIWIRPFDGRIGDRQHAATRFVKNEPARSRKAIAEVIGPHGSLQYGYHSVGRAKGRGLIKVVKDHEVATPTGAGAVLITERGREFLAHVEASE